MSNLAVNQIMIENLKCSICHELLTIPKECEKCQNLFCEQCIQEWLGRNQICPFKCSTQNMKLAEPHKIIKNSLACLKLKIQEQQTPIFDLKQLDPYIKGVGNNQQSKCQNSGCHQYIDISEYENHKQTCQFRIINCEKCKQQYKANQEHDCITYLLQQNKELNIMILQLLEQQETKIIQQHQKPKIATCPQGHRLTWMQTLKEKRCQKCGRDQQRYHCKICFTSFCLNCIKPIINSETCPIGHHLKFKSMNYQDTSYCDICGFSTSYNIYDQTFYSDKQCDLVICSKCFKDLE